jgi:hypothetical protein
VLSASGRPTTALGSEIGHDGHQDMKLQSGFDRIATDHKPRDRAAVDNTLAVIDHGSFVWLRASGQIHGIQCTWVYQRPIDFGGLRRMNGNLAHGLLGRRVECSPLPFGRHRWVSWPESPAIDIARPVRSHAALAEWLEERAAIPVDPECGPCCHIGVLPIEDYGTAVSLVVSHTVIDGIGLCLALADAAKGITHDFGYPPPRSRSRRRALLEDARQTARGMPEVARAVVAATRLAMTELPSSVRHFSVRSSALSRATTLEAGEDKPAVVSTATVYIDRSEWDARAASLGGTSNTLFAGFAARLAEQVGRVRAGDRRVTLTYPVNDRTEGDLRANALKSVDFTVDPSSVTTDLRELRGNIKRALTFGLGKFRRQEAALPLTLLVPKAVVRKLASRAVGVAGLPVGCSYFGDIDPAAACADGTQADYFSVGLVEQNLTEKSHELICGELFLVSGRICGKLFITLRAYQPGAENSRHELAELISRTLADFRLTGEIV